MLNLKASGTFKIFVLEVIMVNPILCIIGAGLYILGVWFLISFETNEWQRFVNFMLKVHKFSRLSNGAFLIALVVVGYIAIVIGAGFFAIGVRDWLEPILLR
jgi:hypothetical protein